MGVWFLVLGQGGREGVIETQHPHFFLEMYFLLNDHVTEKSGNERKGELVTVLAPLS